MLLEHNKVVYEQAVEYFNLGGKDLLITQDTGTGKSYICVELLNTIFKGKKVLYVVPKWSIAENFKDVGGYSDIAENLWFCTYNSFTDKSVCESYFNTYDIFIIDEAHHMSSNVYGSWIVYLMNMCKKENSQKYFIGITATPIREDKVDITRYYSKRIQGITLFEAIGLGLINPFEYLVCSNKILEQAKLLDNNKVLLEDGEYKIDVDYSNSERLLSRLVKNNPRNKWICFFRNISELNEQKSLLERIFPSHKMVELHHNINSSEDIWDYINSLDKVVILSVDMLLEGVHLKGAEGILLFRRTGSMIVFRQILGRISSMKANSSPIVIDCTNSAYKMWRKLLKVQKDLVRDKEEGLGLIGQLGKGSSSEVKILTISLKNKQHFDLVSLLQEINGESFNFKGKVYKSLKSVCQEYGWNETTLLNFKKSLDCIVSKEKLCELFYEAKERESFIYKGVKYSFFMSNDTVRVAEDNGWDKVKFCSFYSKRKKEKTSLEICIEYEKYINKYITVLGEKYKSITDLCKKREYSESHFRSFRERLYLKDSKYKEDSYLEEVCLMYEDFLKAKEKDSQLKVLCEKYNVVKAEYLKYKSHVRGKAKERFDALGSEEEKVQYYKKIKSKSNIGVEYNGTEYKSRSALCKELNISIGVFNWAIREKGLSIEEAVEYCLKEV